MTDINCLLAGLARLLVPVLLLIFWHKRTGARIFPAIAAFLVCLPVFTIAGLIRTGFTQNDLLSFCLKQGLLYGIFEEGSKYLVLRFLLSSYDDRRDAVTYGIGHGAFESFSGGIACIGISDRKHKELLPDEVYEIFKKNYVDIISPIKINETHFVQRDGIEATISFDFNGRKVTVTDMGNGRLDALRRS